MSEERKYAIDSCENRLIITRNISKEKRILVFAQNAIDYLGQPLDDLAKGLKTDADIDNFLLILSKDTNYEIDKQNAAIYVSAPKKQSDDALDQLPEVSEEGIPPPTLDDILKVEDPDRTAGMQHDLKVCCREILELPTLETERKRKRPTTRLNIIPKVERKY